MSIVIGLTGQTGAGKTMLSDSLRARGVSVIDADVIAREVVSGSKSCLGDLALEFGCSIIDHNGELNRRRLSRIVFGDKRKLRRLNAITFPHIVDSISDALAACRRAGTPLVVLDAPTLYEAGCDKMCSFVVAVIAPEEERKRRIMQRDGLSEEEALARIHSQHDDAFFKERAAFIIENAGDPSRMIAQMDDILRRAAPGDVTYEEARA